MSDTWKVRVQDLARHMKDLEAESYEGASSRDDKDEIFRAAFQLTTPVAQQVLNAVNREYLGGRGTVSTRGPESDGAEGLIGIWSLAWPELSRAVDRHNARPIAPVELVAVFPAGWTHGHLALFTSQEPRQIVANWPFQVTNSDDAERQEPILWAIAEAELHERVLRAGHSSLGLFP